jgi:hypothetical protein
MTSLAKDPLMSLLRILILGRLDCPAADSISEKVTCSALSLGISGLTYSAVTYALLSLIPEGRAFRIKRAVVQD